MSSRMPTSAGLLVVSFLLLGVFLATPVFATFCEISNISYNYPHQVAPGQSFTTTVTVSGTCASDDADWYSIRSDLNDMSGLVLSEVSVPIGFSQGQSWTVSAQNEVTAPTTPAPWQIQFAMYIFAAIGSGGTIDSVTYKPVTIQVGTSQMSQTEQTSTSVNSVMTQTEVPSSTVPLTSLSSTNMSTQTAETTQQASPDIYQSLAAVLILILLVAVAVLIRQRKSSKYEQQPEPSDNR